MKKQIQSLASLITSTAGVFRLPKTLALHIFSFLPARDIDSLAQVCKYWSLLVPTHLSLITSSAATTNTLTLLCACVRACACAVVRACVGDGVVGAEVQSVAVQGDEEC